MAEYITTGEALTAVAEAIRTRGGTVAGLEWPTGFEEAIAAIPAGSAPQLTLGTIRPDAELVKTVAYDKLLVHDEVIESWPSYSTSAQALLASGSIDTYQCDLDNYNYAVLLYMTCKPSYSVDTAAKGRLEYWFGTYLYDLCEIPANTFVAASGKKFATRNLAFSGNATGREFYWSSGSAVTVYSTSSQGIYQTATAPSITSGGLMTLKSPSFNVKGHTTYFTSTFFNAVTDVRFQYLVKVYRSPKGNMNLDGWMATQMANHVLECINGSGTLA